MVFEEEVLSDSEVKATISGDFEFIHADLDRSPEWGDIPGFQGLPSLAFFDRGGRHVLTRSGYLPPAEVLTLLRAVSDKLASGELEPYPAPPPGRALADRALDPAELAKELKRLEFAIFLRVNSHDGGFDTPSRNPYPSLLVELELWRQAGAPPRVSEWIDRTVESALRGSSPRHDGEILRDMDFTGEELRTLSLRGPDAGPRWREGVDRLPQADPFRGLQDPVDGGMYRYCAGPGWYHPHFERRSVDNLAWAELAALQDREADAERHRTFIERTFATGSLLASTQRSDPFYARLQSDERRDIPAPPVASLTRVEVQARAAQVDAARCPSLLHVQGDTWPRALWTEIDGVLAEAGQEAATPDAVGELLAGLASCQDQGEVYREATRRLLATVRARWRDPLPSTARLQGLVRGICRASDELCPLALATVADMPFDPAYPPPLVEFARRIADPSTPGTSP